LVEKREYHEKIFAAASCFRNAEATRGGENFENLGWACSTKLSSLRDFLKNRNSKHPNSFRFLPVHFIPIINNHPTSSAKTE
jgi:hypothetical protein